MQGGSSADGASCGINLLVRTTSVELEICASLLIGVQQLRCAYQKASLPLIASMGAPGLVLGQLRLKIQRQKVRPEPTRSSHHIE
jgi:hypothetical protein